MSVIDVASDGSTRVQLQRQVAEDKIRSQLKTGIWLYLLLLLFEGALRKWFLPSLATPLLIVRDPISLWLVLQAWKWRILPANFFITWMVAIGVIGIYTSVFWGHKNLLLAIYGSRVILFHFPLMFVIGSLFDRNDVIKSGKMLLWLSLPMTILIVLQFFNPQSAWVNRGVGGDLNGAGFGGALGFFRPSGTFSFTNGVVLFYGLVTCFIFYFWIQSKEVNKVLLICATACLFAAIPLSISRTLFFQFGVSLIFAFIAISRKPKYMGRLILAAIGGVITLAILNNTSFFQTATEAFTSRFDSANEEEGGLEGVLGDRYLGGMIGALSRSSEQPLFGYGLGMGTNVGAMLLSGQRTFLIAEEEWARIIGELGPILGLIVIFIRMGICVKMTLNSYKALSIGNLLPWLLLSLGLLTIPQGQWAQPTSLGFSIIIGGLILASSKEQTSGQKLKADI